MVSRPKSPSETPGFFASCARNVEDLLALELEALGASGVRPILAGVHFMGTVETAMAACLWSRIANRVFLPLARFPAPDPEILYRGVRRISWEKHLDAGGTFSVDANVSASGITNSSYAALKSKDALVDRFRDRTGSRPSVRTLKPDVRINVHIHKDEATVSLDLSGDSLHLRGYRTEKGTAPLREDLAAAILMRAGWPQAAARGGSLVDPMCGSGTLPIEGALMAADIAPGLKRDYFGFLGWKGFKRGMWRALLVDARFRAEEGKKTLPEITGCDRDERILNIARQNLKRAGLEGLVRFERRDIDASFREISPGEKGLVVVNPPYGRRLGSGEDLKPLYRALGTALKAGYPGWDAAVLAGEPELGKEMGLKAHKKHVLYNGPIRCELLHFHIRGDSGSEP